MQDLRQQQLHAWLTEQGEYPIDSLTCMNGDAGFRRYFRFFSNKQSFIAVDSPVDSCNNSAFVDVCTRLKQAGILVPEILAHHQAKGFFWLSDLGDQVLAQVVNEENMSGYYRQAIELLPDIAQIPTQGLPEYDADFVQLELTIFVDWLLEHHLSISLSAEDRAKLQQCFDVLIDSALAQPKVFMHRDFHSRNIMCVEQSLAVIDFQDAVHGPITYDIVSLLRDCYLKWPKEQVRELFHYYLSLMAKKGLLSGQSPEQWQRWFDLMGVQRHVKAAGIFARLYHRDGKAGYLGDIPLTLSYIVDVCADYDELSYLFDLVKETVLPKLLEWQMEVS